MFAMTLSVCPHHCEGSEAIQKHLVKNKFLCQFEN